MQPQQSPRKSNTISRTGLRNDSDLTELLGLAAATPRLASSAATFAPAPQPVPAPQPKSLNDIFTSYLKFEHDLGDLCAAQGTMQKLLFGEDWRPIVDSPSTQGIYRVATAAIGSLIQLAQKRFAPTGGKLEINPSETLQAVGMDRWADEYDRRNRRSESSVIPPVDLDKLWAHLEANYGGDAGIETSHRQNAQFIIKKLRLDGDTEMKRTASSVSCFMHFYGKIITYGSNSGRYESGHGDRSDLVRLFEGLACAFEWAELDQLSIELAPNRHGMCEYGFNFKPREKICFTGMEIVLFKEKWEVKFSKATAEKLMLYLGTYGQS